MVDDGLEIGVQRRRVGVVSTLQLVGELFCAVAKNEVLDVADERHLGGVGLGGPGVPVVLYFVVLTAPVLEAPVLAGDDVVNAPDAQGDLGAVVAAESVGHLVESRKERVVAGNVGGGEVEGLGALVVLVPVLDKLVVCVAPQGGCD